MMIYDFLFLAVVLISAVSLISAAILAVSGLGRRAIRLLKWWGIGAAVYTTTAAAVALALPLQVFHVGDIQCEDDWCLAVESAHRVAPDTYEVVLRMINQARRVAQRNNNGVVVYVTDDRNTRYPPLPAPDAPAFDVQIQPGESVSTVRRFHVPQTAKGLGLIVGPQRWLPIIGREPFQKTVVSLD
jgi:hypothetical protein